MPQYKEKSGTWRTLVYYHDYMGNLKQKQKRGFKTKKEAKEYELEFLSSYKNNITLKQGMEEYFTYISSRLRESTVRNKKWYSKNLEYMNSLVLLEITPKNIMDWQSHMISLGKTNKTINQSTEILYSIYSYNGKMYNHTYNPVKSLDKLPVENKKMDFWTVDEFNTFLGYLDDLEKIIAFKILFYTGIRYGELLGLTIGDIHDNYIDINKSYDYRSKKFCATKNKHSVRKVYIHKRLKADIDEYIKTIYRPRKNDRLFNKTTNSWLQSQLKRTCKRYGFHHIRIHDLRHSHASMLINNGVDVLIISERLGHINPTTTLNTYSHLYKNRSSEAVDFLDQLEE